MADPFLIPGPFTMGAQVDDLVGLLGGRKAVLVGHSYGGNVAFATADHHPELVAGVAVYETPLSWEPWWPAHHGGFDRRCRVGQPAGRWRTVPSSHAR